ncbi:MAG TPA: DUF5996 family protein [Vicinamibacterales bacterium]|nr:DUF5996 family protein [Vicinamibacterales bacterium]
MTEDRWPPLPYDAWRDTYATLHMWMQIAGKVTLALAPPVNHSWAIAMHLTPRGLSTPLLSHGDRTFAIEFDFLAHRLIIEVSDGQRWTMALRPMSVAEFHRDVMQALRDLALPVKIWPMPVEVPDPIRFELDTQHHSYDPEYANRFWRILVQVGRVLGPTRCNFVGKCSPLNFFWGAMDLALTKFSGRPAPPRDGPYFMQEAYSHEVISHGFWPGSGFVLEPAFYAYAAPEPPGLKEARIRPDAAYYHRDFGEFILPYEAVRTAASPDEAIRQFVASTYDAAATLARWDRATLERQRPSSSLTG